MKNRFIALMLGSLLVSGQAVAENEKAPINAFFASSYLNFYLMNLNACEEFHPGLQTAANEAEQKLYPYLQKLHAHIQSGALSDKEQKQVKDLLVQRKAMINEQIKSGELTTEHCQTVIDIVVNEGLDQALLSRL